MTEESWLGRGWIDVAGRPLGWAWHQERDEIRRHLRRRVWRFGLDGMAPARLEERVTAIQRRLHRHKPTMAERQAKWRAAQPKPKGADLRLTWEELERIVDLHQGANDPVTASIAAKAAKALEGRPEGA